MDENQTTYLISGQVKFESVIIQYSVFFLNYYYYFHIFDDTNHVASALCVGCCHCRFYGFILFIFFPTGFVLGGAFGIFTAGIDSNAGIDPKDPLRTPTAREVLKDMGQRGMSYAKNFAIVGAMFSCTECIIESVSTRWC